MGEIGPPAAKTDFFKNGLYFDEIRPRGSFWGVEDESEVRLLNLSPEVAEIGPPTAKISINDPMNSKTWNFSPWEVDFSGFRFEIRKSEPGFELLTQNNPYGPSLRLIE